MCDMVLRGEIITGVMRGEDGAACLFVNKTLIYGVISAPYAWNNMHLDWMFIASSIFNFFILIVRYRIHVINNVIARPQKLTATNLSLCLFTYIPQV